MRAQDCPSSHYFQMLLPMSHFNVEMFEIKLSPANETIGVLEFHIDGSHRFSDTDTQHFRAKAQHPPQTKSKHIENIQKAMFHHQLNTENRRTAGHC